MLNKKVLLGTLVAGAFLLPMAVNAGVVTGPCVNCHTMHDSVDGGAVNATGPNPMLLKGNGCEGCHATTTGNDPVTGMAAFATFSAPQVNDAGNPNLAGYFVADTAANALAAEGNQHNVYNDLLNVVQDTVLANTAPGPTAGGAMSCTGCHDEAGGHHGAGGSYRLLFPIGAIQTDDSNYGNSGTIPPDVNDTVYDSALMNGVCATCHGGFHGLSNQQNGTGAWVRHPTDISLTQADAASMATYSYVTNYGGTSLDLTPVGTNATGDTDALMCITCHYSHGGPYADLLRFDYTAQVAQLSAGAATPGCETCHSYAATGTPGM